MGQDKEQGDEDVRRMRRRRRHRLGKGERVHVGESAMRSVSPSVCIYTEGLRVLRDSQETVGGKE